MRSRVNQLPVLSSSLLFCTKNFRSVLYAPSSQPLSLDSLFTRNPAPSKTVGPDQASALLSRPRFLWGTRNASWTDDVGDKEPFVIAVRRLLVFHDTLTNPNSNKARKTCSGMILQWQLYGRAKIRGSALANDFPLSEDGVGAVADSVYKMDSLSAGSAAYSDYVKLSGTGRGPNETLSNCEDRFTAALTMLNFNLDAVSVPATLVAWSFIYSANIDLSHYLGAMSSAVSSA